MNIKDEIERILLWELPEDKLGKPTEALVTLFSRVVDIIISDEEPEKVDFSKKIYGCRNDAKGRNELRKEMRNRLKEML